MSTLGTICIYNFGRKSIFNTRIFAFSIFIVNIFFLYALLNQQKQSFGVNTTKIWWDRFNRFDVHYCIQTKRQRDRICLRP